jgi:hypothetical protein
MVDEKSRSWICNDTVFFNSSGNIPDDEINQDSGIFEYVFPVIQTKFQYKYNITVLREESIDGISCYVSQYNNSLIIINDEQIYCERGSFVLCFSDVETKIINGGFIKKTFKFLDVPPEFGSGKNKYTVKSIVKDEYEVNVLADSEEEAIACASKINIEHWHHLALHPELDEVVFMRVGKWGIFEARKIS